MSGKKLNANKFALIYQFNNESPLFARVASDELENGNLEKAIEILEQGIKIHPKYPTAYFIYSKALAKSGKIAQAREMVKAGSDILGNSETETYYSELIEELNQLSSNNGDSRRISFVDEDILEKDFDKAEKFEDKLDDLAVTLSKAKIKAPTILEDDALAIEEQIEEQEEEKELPPNMISETLAGIFFAQGNYKQARQIYKKLIETEPAKMNLFAQKIAELDKLIEEQN